MSTGEYTTTIGRVDSDRKVHLAHGVNDQAILCRFGAARQTTTVTLAEIPADADACDVLLAAEVAISHLCRNCFPVRTRARYSARIKAAIAALPATD